MMMNSLLAGIADVHLCRLQSVQNAAACLVSGARRHDHITPILATLHWLPVRQRVIFNTAVLVCKCLHDAVPRYLTDLCVPVASTDGCRQSCSAVFGALLVPWTRTSTATQLCCIWPQDLELTTNGSSITITNTVFVQVPGLDSSVYYRRIFSKDSSETAHETLRTISGYLSYSVFLIFCLLQLYLDTRYIESSIHNHEDVSDGHDTTHWQSALYKMCICIIYWPLNLSY